MNEEWKTRNQLLQQYYDTKIALKVKHRIHLREFTYGYWTHYVAYSLISSSSMNTQVSIRLESQIAKKSHYHLSLFKLQN